MDSTRRQAAIRMARGLPWEDLEQFLAFYDKRREDARRSAWTLLIIVLIVGAGTVLLFCQEPKTQQLIPHLILPAACVAAAVPLAILFSYLGSKKRAEKGLRTVLDEIDDPGFVPVALGILSEKHADLFSFRTDIFRAIARLLPEISVEQCRDWTPEERYALSHGLNTVLPTSAGGRDALSYSPNDFAVVTLKVLQRIGDSRELEIVRLVSTIDPITDQHQKVREAAVKCIRSIEKRMHQGSMSSGSSEIAEAPVNPVRAPVRGTETDVRHLLKRVHSRKVGNAVVMDE
jgi:hypothetical protein